VFSDSSSPWMLPWFLALMVVGHPLAARSAVADFLNNATLGSASVDRDFLDYSHSIFVEASMAMDVVGLLMIVALSWSMIRPSVSRLRERHSLIACLFLQYFVVSQHSGSMWGTGAFWICAAFLLTLSPPYVAPTRLPVSDRTSFVTPLPGAR
jgi:hypothetical protein